jgi:hypothetical protein
MDAKGDRRRNQIGLGELLCKLLAQFLRVLLDL